MSSLGSKQWWALGLVAALCFAGVRLASSQGTGAQAPGAVTAEQGAAAVGQGAATAEQGTAAVGQDAAIPAAKTATAIFAGGCFWCMEPPFDALDGVIETTSGYTGGHAVNPTYEEVSSGMTGHAESLRVTYDPARVSYAKLLEVFWRNVDPLTADGQFCDHGTQYRSEIFVADEEQRRKAEASKVQLDESGRFKQPIVTKIVPATTFYPAETYHQDYYKKNPIRYRFYRHGCGRDARLEELWGDEAGGPGGHH